MRQSRRQNQQWALKITLLLSTVLGSAAQQVPTPPDPDGSKISVDVNLVVLHATVYDQRGHFVSGLTEQNFRVYEDGILQHISRFGHDDVPITAGLVVDHSGSMRRKLAEVSAAVRVFVQSSNPGDQMFVVNFNEAVQLALPGFTNDASQVEQAISKAPAGGETALYDAIVTALEHLKAGTLEKKILLVISDGGDNASHCSFARALQMAEQSNAIIYAVGIFDEDDPDRNPGTLRRLARSTGGMAFFPSDLSQVSSICEQIARDVRSQYMLAYQPANPVAHGDYRSIRVTASAPHHGKLIVRTRTGYRVGNEPSARP